MSLRLSRNQIIFASLLTLAGVFLVLLSTQKYGPGVSSDSAFYLSSADNFAQGGGFISFNGAPLVDWPPLYSFILGVIYKLTGISYLQAGRFLNALFFGLTIYSSAVLYKHCFKDRILWFYLGTLATFLFLPLLTTAANISTDLIFLWFEVVFFLAASHFLAEKSGLQLLLVSIISAVATMLRWVGYLMILTEIVLIIIVYWRDIKKAILYCLVFGGIAAFPFVAWVIGRNYLRYHTFFGPRDTGLVSIPGNIVLTFAKINHWFFPLSITERLPVIIIWLGLFVVLLVLNRKKDWLRWARRWIEDPILPVLFFSLLYYVFIILTIYTGDHLITDYYDDRLQSPLFFALLIGIFLTLDELVLVHVRESRRKLADQVIIILIIIWSLYPANMMYKFVRYSLEDGVVAYNNYNTKKLNESGLVEFLRSFHFKSGLPVYTNYSEAVYLFTGQDSVASPKDNQSYTAVPAHLTSQLSRWPEQSRAYFIWFKSNEKRNYFSPQDLAVITDMEALYEGKEGQMYIVSPK
jgi:hypothetical protein